MPITNIAHEDRSIKVHSGITIILEKGTNIKMFFGSSQFNNGGKSTQRYVVDGSIGIVAAPSIFPIAAPVNTPAAPALRTAANVANQDNPNESLKTSALPAELTNELPPSKGPSSPWAKSRAKSELQKVCEDPTSRIHVMSFSDIYALPIFAQYKRGNFKSNFERLYKKITGGADHAPKTNPETQKKTKTSTMAQKKEGTKKRRPNLGKQAWRKPFYSSY